jgi:hypothetical protein
VSTRLNAFGTPREGRLFPEELEQRLHAAFAARTYADLDAIVRDLPSPATVESTRPSTFTRLRPAVPWLVALAVVLVILMAAAVTVRRRMSLAAPIPPPQTTATAAPQP